MTNSKPNTCLRLIRTFPTYASIHTFRNKDAGCPQPNVSKKEVRSSVPVARCLALIDKKNYQTSHSGFRSPDFKKNTQKQLPALEITLLEPNTYDAPKPRQPMTTRVIPETLASSGVVPMLKLLWSGGCWKGSAAYSDTTSGICRCAVQDGR